MAYTPNTKNLPKPTAHRIYPSAGDAELVPMPDGYFGDGAFFLIKGTPPKRYRYRDHGYRYRDHGGVPDDFVSSLLSSGTVPVRLLYYSYSEDEGYGVSADPIPRLESGDLTNSHRVVFGTGDHERYGAFQQSYVNLVHSYYPPAPKKRRGFLSKLSYGLKTESPNALIFYVDGVPVAAVAPLKKRDDGMPPCYGMAKKMGYIG